jgi:AcrR family transcriptional regulator
MVLTIRPSWATGGHEPGGPRTSERLTIRRIAMPLMLEHGYDAVTVDDIATEAGISRRTFFRLFGGKDQIVSCDHEVYHLELHTHLLQHQGERTVHRAAKGAALVVEGLTAVAADAESRAALLTSSPSLRAEESRWFERHQITIAAFLSQHPDTTTVESEMAAAAIIAAARVSIREHASSGEAQAAKHFEAAITFLTRAEHDPVRQIAIIETSLPIEELIARLRNPS